MYLKITCIQDKLTLQLNLNARTTIMRRKKLTNNLLKKVKKIWVNVHNYKECLNISKVAKFESYILKSK